MPCILCCARLSTQSRQPASPAALGESECRRCRVGNLSLWRTAHYLRSAASVRKLVRTASAIVRLRQLSKPLGHDRRTAIEKCSGDTVHSVHDPVIGSEDNRVEWIDLANEAEVLQDLPNRGPLPLIKPVLEVQALAPGRPVTAGVIRNWLRPSPSRGGTHSQPSGKGRKRKPGPSIRPGRRAIWPCPLDDRDPHGSEILALDPGSWNQSWNQVSGLPYADPMPQMGSGHIEHLPSGSFRVSVYAGYGSQTSSRRYFRGTAKDIDQAQIVLGRLIEQDSIGRQPEWSATVAQLLKQYMAITDLDVSTRESYEGYIQRTILPALGSYQLRKARGPSCGHGRGGTANRSPGCGGHARRLPRLHRLDLISL